MQEINALTEKALEMQKQGIALLGKTRTEGADKDSVKAWSDKGRALLGKSGEIFDQRKALEKKISADNPDLAYSAEILHYDYDLMKKGMDKYEEAFNALSSRVQKCPAGQVLADFIATQKATAIGAEAPGLFTGRYRRQHAAPLGLPRQIRTAGFLGDMVRAVPAVHSTSCRTVFKSKRP